MNENKKDYTFLLILIVILAFILRYYKADTASLWADDAFSYYLSLQNITGILKYLYTFDAHPPLFYFFLHFWVKLGQNPLFLRMPGIIIGSLSIFGVYLLCKELLNKKFAIIAAFFTALSVSHVYMCREIRMYPYLSFFIIFAFYFFTKLFARGQASELRFDGTNRNCETCPLSESAGGGLAHEQTITALPPYRSTPYIYWILYTLCMVISWYLHYFGIIAMISQNIIVLLFRKKINIKYWLYSQIAVLICYAPWFKYLFYQLFSSRGPTEAGFTWKHIFLMFDYFFTSIFISYPAKNAQVFIYAIFALCVIILIFSLINNHKNKFFIAVSFFGFYTQFVILYAKSILTQNSMFQLRYFYYILPLYFMIIIGSFLNKEKFKPLMAAVIIPLFLFFNFMGLYNYYNVKEFTIQRWDEGARYMEQYYDKNDGIIVQNLFQTFPFNYYFKPKHKEYYVTKDSASRQLSVAMEKHKRIWLVKSFAYYEDPNNVVERCLLNDYKFVRGARFSNYIQPDADITVALFEKTLHKK